MLRYHLKNGMTIGDFDAALRSNDSSSIDAGVFANIRSDRFAFVHGVFRRD